MFTTTTANSGKSTSLQHHYNIIKHPWTHVYVNVSLQLQWTPLDPCLCERVVTTPVNTPGPMPVWTCRYNSHTHSQSRPFASGVSLQLQWTPLNLCLHDLSLVLEKPWTHIQISVPSQCIKSNPDAFPYNRSSQCSTTGVTKAVVCVILSVELCI